MSTKTRGLPGYDIINASTQKPAETAMVKNSPSRATDEPRTHSRYPPVAGNAGSANIAIAMQREEIETSLANISVIDKQKVAQLRQAIREGTYRIDAERIADKLIALERALSK
jgi:negative regulator of flagellin synthesis FlgM